MLILLLKAKIARGAAGDLFQGPVQVAGHMRGATYVQPYQSTRKRVREDAVTGADRKYLAWHRDRDPRRQLTAPLHNVAHALDAMLHRDFPFKPDEVQDAYGRATAAERTQMESHGQAAEAARAKNNKGVLTRHAKQLATLVAYVRQREGLEDGADENLRRWREITAAGAGKMPPAPPPPDKPSRLARRADQPPSPAPEPAAEAAPPAKDWRDEPDWHSRTQARMKTLSDESLRYVARDAAAAARAGDTMGSRSAGRYADEASYAAAELRARQARAATKPAAPESGRYSHAVPAVFFPGYYAIDHTGEKMRGPDGGAIRWRTAEAAERWGQKHNRRHAAAAAG